MPLSAGDRLGPFEILAPLGAGGMGEVYRAKDTKLKRDVALKVLPQAFAGDAERMARFQREAQVLASLNHPNIAQIYGIEDRALVMELVPGETLRTPLPLSTAVECARQIAEALEAAHEKGIVHRDLKPANVMVTPEGVAKVLDFGLAAMAQGSVSNAGDPSNSPTMTMRATEAGRIMGTAAYMSPEQAVGKAVDKRADIWSFGVVLYEMLAGQPLFKGETLPHILADVIRSDIDFEQLPADTPAPIRNLLTRCLDRDVKSRLRDIGEARVAMQNYRDLPLSSAQVPEVAVARPSRAPWIVAAVSTLAALALGYVAYQHIGERPSRAVVLSFPPPNGGTFLSGTTGLDFVAASPDGLHIVFQAVVEGKEGIWLRDLDSPNARRLTTGGNASGPFWSPDSRWIGYYESGKLKKIDRTGGPATTLCDSAGFLGASWNQDDVILFASLGNSIQRVNAAGGQPSPVTQMESAKGDESHRFPWFLPDGRHFLYTVVKGDQASSSVYAGDISSKERKQILDVPSKAIYVSPGYLLYVRNRTLMAQGFDAGKLRTTNTAVPLRERVSYNPYQLSSNFGASQNGVLAYTSDDLANAQLTWFDRLGRVLGTVGSATELESIALSPNQMGVVAVRLDPQTGNADLWLHDLARQSDSRLTYAGSNRFPVWSSDGTRIAFRSVREGSTKIYQKDGNGSGREEVLEASDRFPLDWSRDGRYLITGTSNQTPVTGNDLWVSPLFGDRKPFPYVKTQFGEFWGRLSPDGRWLSYDSNESNRREVYVTSFPNPGGKWQVSTRGGSRAVWRRDGKELYFLGLDGTIMAAEIRPGPAFQAGVPKPLFAVRMLLGNTNFEVSNDGRFLVPNLTERSALPMTVVLNWTALLR